MGVKPWPLHQNDTHSYLLLQSKLNSVVDSWQYDPPKKNGHRSSFTSCALPLLISLVDSVIRERYISQHSFSLESHHSSIHSFANFTDASLF
jgi:hypothetical protein